MKNVRILDYIFAFCACLCASVDLIHAVYPSFLRRKMSFLEFLPAYWPTTVLAVISLFLTVFLYIHTRNRAHGGYVNSHTFFAGLAAVLALLAVLLSGFISIQHPHGLVSGPVQKAPLQQRETAREVLSSALGTCQPGWVDLGESDISGMTFGIVCSSLKTAYAEFQTPEAAHTFKMKMKAEGPLLMKNYDSATWQPKQTEYDGMSGSLWIAITPRELSGQLNSVIGGHVERLN